MILAVTGLQRERRILAGPDVEVVAGGGDQARLEAELERLAPDRARHHQHRHRGRAGAGIAARPLGGGRRPSTMAAARCRPIPTGPIGWPRACPGPNAASLLGVDAVAATAEQKAELRRATDAIAVDMESHVAARVARHHRRPFVAARVISDAAHRTLPPAARVGMRADGNVDLPAVLRSLAAAPWQLPALIRTGLEAETAFRALLRGRRLLGRGLGGGSGGPNVGKLPPDMV